MIEFPHTAPKGYSYEFENYKRGVVRVWILNHGEFVYTEEQVKSVWGFYKTKTKEYHAPVNAKKVGDVVDIRDTTPYSAMQIVKPMRTSVLAFC